MIHFYQWLQIFFKTTNSADWVIQINFTNVGYEKNILCVVLIRLMLFFELKIESLPNFCRKATQNIRIISVQMMKSVKLKLMIRLN